MATVICGHILPISGEASFVESPGRDAPLVNSVQLRKFCEELNPYSVHERPFGSSHAEDEGGDAQKFEQKTGQWLIRDQLKIPQIDSIFEIEKRQRMERLKDLKHSLKQDWKCGLISSQVRDMEPGRSRDKDIEWFWILVCNSSHSYDPGYLQTKGWDLAEYLHLIDEIHAESSSRSFQVSASAGMSFWRKWKHRSSAISGMGDLAPQ
jgi:hypothetical protein